jgi:hypothetical protein
LKVLTPYQRVSAAVDRCKEIQTTLKEASWQRQLDAEVDVKLIGSLTKEFQWTVKKIITICNEGLDQDIEGEYGQEVDERIKLEQILEQYSRVWDQIKDKNEMS